MSRKVFRISDLPLTVTLEESVLILPDGSVNLSRIPDVVLTNTIFVKGQVEHVLIHKIPSRPQSLQVLSETDLQYLSDYIGQPIIIQYTTRG